MDTLIIIYIVMEHILNIIDFFPKKSYHSLGHFCLTSTFLKTLKVKQYSCPFDWIFSNNDMISSCLSTKFNVFLNKQYYNTLQPTQNEKKRCNHSIYGDIFNHHNPNIITDYEYFQRCIDRFNNLIKSDELKVFYIISYDVLNLHNFLTFIAPYLDKFVLIYIQLNKNDLNSNIEYNYVYHNIIVYTFHFKSDCTGVNFADSQETELLLNHLKKFIK